MALHGSRYTHMFNFVVGGLYQTPSLRRIPSNAGVYDTLFNFTLNNVDVLQPTYLYTYVDHVRPHDDYGVQ